MGTEPPANIPPADTLSGTVREVIAAGGYTYVKLQTGTGDVWVAAPEFPAATGDRLTVAVDLPMRDFHSKALDRDFPLVYFAVTVTRAGKVLQSALPAEGHGGGAAVAGGPVSPVAPAPGGLTIADVWAKRTSLAGKTVTVRGTVVKVNNGIMDRNWLHLQDGSGSADSGTNDLTVTTAGRAGQGDVITASGVIAVDKEFGGGYGYAVILENATLSPK